MAGETLTISQKAAVENRGGPLLVSAAAGSGKTKVLVDRLLGYLTDKKDPANIDDFLIITYTKAAASELRAKIASKLTERMAQEPENRHLQRQMQRLYLSKISTVHSFCSDLLREYAFYLELPGDVRVAEETECQAYREEAMQTVLEEAYLRIQDSPALQSFVDTQGFGRNDKVVPQLVEQVYDSARCHVRPEQWITQCVEQAKVQQVQDASETVWGAYLIERLHNYLDSQMESLTVALHLARTQEDLGPKYGPMLEANREQLQTLRNCRTWQEIYENRITSFGRIPPVKNPLDTDCAQRVKALREAAWEGVKKYQEPFSTPSQKILEDLEQTALSVEGLMELVSAFGKRYAWEKERHRVLDFGDLEHKTLELLLGKNLSGPTRIASEVADRFREVMVDEYQDTNEVQDCIFSVLTQKRGNCFMVGDVKQSIYRFRLADPGIFLDKYNHYADYDKAKPGEGRKILLSQNFRSGHEVLSAANDVFRQTMCPQVGGLYYGEAESLRAGICRAGLPQTAVELHCLELRDGVGKYETEARYVARRIAKLLAEKTMIREGESFRPVTPGDIVILLRSPGNIAQYYVQALQAQGIPASADGGESILDSGEINVLWDLLRVVDNPLQDIALHSVLASPVFGFSADHLGALRAGHREGCLYDCLCHGAEAGDQEASDFLDTLQELRQTARLETLARLLEEIYRRTRMESVFGAMENGACRRRNLELFYETAAAYEQGGHRDLSQFLEYLESLREKGLKGQEGTKAQCVTVLSIHKSKGLEYPVVVLSDLSKRFNQEDKRPNLLVDPNLGIGCSVLDRENRCRYPSLAKMAIACRIDEENVSEELRVLYVAMTRAKDMLLMTYADKYVSSKLSKLALRLQPEHNFLLSQEAGSLGHWVLMTALGRTEAGELFQECGYPIEPKVSDIPWGIYWRELGKEETLPAAVQEEASVPAWTADVLSKALPKEYPYQAASLAPSKVTATELKGRELDQEAAEGAYSPNGGRKRRWQMPNFSPQKGLDSRGVGVATHLAMQFIRYECCSTAQGIEEELTRLVERAFLTPEQGNAVNRKWILDFFSTPLGKRLSSGQEVLREFKFSVLEDGTLLSSNLAGEQLLLQGVVDCCLMEEDGMTILDFKTDHVRPGGEPIMAQRYVPQLQAYSRALGKIFEKPVKKLLLYFFQTGTLQEVENPRY